jgi:hypothetical protein
LWDDGYPVGGGSSLSRYFDDRPFRSALWFQTVGNTRGQAWSGAFRDVDGNGVMEFAPAETPLPQGRWTRELNFLGWQPVRGSGWQDLPAGKMRVSVQWTEPHEPEYFGHQPDPYRVPIANLILLVLRQRDPTGTKLAADDLEVVARSTGLPLRIDNAPTFAIYEQTVEFTIAAPGRYAVRVEGKVGPTIRPVNEPTLPGMQVRWELRPRLFVNALDEASRAAGRPVFWDYPSEQGDLGMAADAHDVVSLGAADLSGKPARYSSTGPAFGQQLHGKPDILTFAVSPPGIPGDKVAPGVSLATGFAAGVAASALSGEPSGQRFLSQLRRQRGQILRLP